MSSGRSDGDTAHQMLEYGGRGGYEDIPSSFSPFSADDLDMPFVEDVVDETVIAPIGGSHEWSIRIIDCNDIERIQIGEESLLQGINARDRRLWSEQIGIAVRIPMHIIILRIHRLFEQQDLSVSFADSRRETDF